LRGIASPYHAWLNDAWVRIPPEKIVPDFAPDGQAYLFMLTFHRHDGPGHHVAVKSHARDRLLCPADRWQLMRALIIAAMLLVPAQTHALEIGARLPTSDGELIVIRNDGGIRNATDYFGYGTVCRADLNLRTWLVVKRIVSDRALVEVDLNVRLLD
jgi:hypothetical protein